VNGDGASDVLVGARFEDPGGSPTDAGRAYIFSGATGTVLYTLISPNEEEFGSFGISVLGPGDVDNDGYLDVVVGAYHETPAGGPSRAGRAYVITPAFVSVPDIAVVNPAVLVMQGPFPNPTVGPVRLLVRVLANDPNQTDLSLYDTMGRHIETVMKKTVIGEDNLTLNWRPRNETPSGIYYWRLRAGKHTIGKQMVILK
jgi:hypothetical protein